MINDNNAAQSCFCVMAGFVSIGGWMPKDLEIAIWRAARASCGISTVLYVRGPS
jgi:hypothetical protein